MIRALLAICFTLLSLSVLAAGAPDDDDLSQGQKEVLNRYEALMFFKPDMSFEDVLDIREQLLCLTLRREFGYCGEVHQHHPEVVTYGIYLTLFFEEMLDYYSEEILFTVVLDSLKDAACLEMEIEGLSGAFVTQEQLKE